MALIKVLPDFKFLTLSGPREEGPGENGIGPRVVRRAGSRSPQVPAGTPANTQDSAKKKANRERLTSIYWWWVVDQAELGCRA